MNPRLLLDTHIFVRFASTPQKLSKDQLRVLRDATRRGEPLAVSAITLLEIALFKGGKGSKLRVPVDELFEVISSTGCQIVPLDVAVASEVAAMGDSLKDPADRTIVATARVHGMRLVTSDQRIIDSELVTVVE